MSKPRYEYQVSESAQADRKYFTDPKEALRVARKLAAIQPHHVYIDVYDLWMEQMADVWYTVKGSKLRKHIDGKELKCVTLS